MLLWFDSNGVLKEQLTYGSPARAGTTDFKIIAHFDGVSADTGTLKLIKPDLYNSSYPLLFMSRIEHFVFDSDIEESNFFEDGQDYTVFEFDFSDYTGSSQDLIVLLDGPGLWSAVISLYNADTTISVQGLINFNVQTGINIEDGSVVSTDEVIANIGTQFAKKVEKTGDPDRIYGTDDGGNQTTYSLHDFARALEFQGTDTLNDIYDVAGTDAFCLKYQNNYYFAFIKIEGPAGYKTLFLGNNGLQAVYHAAVIGTTTLADYISNYNYQSVKFLPLSVMHDSDTLSQLYNKVSTAPFIFSVSIYGSARTYLGKLYSSSASRMYFEFEELGVHITGSSDPDDNVETAKYRYVGVVAESTTLQSVLGGTTYRADYALASDLPSKLNVIDGIVVLSDISVADLSSYSVGQAFYDKTTNELYIKTESSYERLSDEHVKFIDLSDYSTYLQLFNEVGYAPFIVDIEDVTTILRFVYVEHFGYHINATNPYGVFETGILTMTDPIPDTFTWEIKLSNDSIIKIDTVSGTLTDTEYEIAQQPNAYILFQNVTIYHKDKDFGGYITFRCLQLQYDDLNHQLYHNIISINKNASPKTYSLSRDIIDTFYNKSQIDYIIENLPTPTGGMPTYEFTGSETLASILTTAGTEPFIAKYAGNYYFAFAVQPTNSTQVRLFLGHNGKTYGAKLVEGTTTLSQYVSKYVVESVPYQLIVSNVTLEEMVDTFGIEKPFSFSTYNSARTFTYFGKISTVSPNYYFEFEQIGMTMGSSIVDTDANISTAKCRFVGCVAGSTTLYDILFNTNTYKQEYATEAEISAINTALSGKEDTTNKVTTLSGSSTDTQYPSAKVVWDKLSDIREIAEGKCKTFILSYADTLSAVKTDLTNHSDKKMTLYSTDADVTAAFLNGDYDTDIYDNANFNSQNDSINATSGYIICKGVDSYGVSGSDYYLVYVEDQAPAEGDVRNGDVFLIVEVDVPDRWFGADGSGSKFYKMETSKVDLSNYVDKTTDQTITGVKTISYGNKINFKIPNDNAFGLGGNQWGYLQVDYNGAGMFSFGTTAFFPNSHNSRDLGTNSLSWKDLYLSGVSYFKNTSSTYTYTLQASSNNYFYISTTSSGIAIAPTKKLLPLGNADHDLGTDYLAWKDGYFSGQVYAQNTFNVINASDITNDTLTQAQYDLFTNGKPVLIIGTFLSIKNPIFIVSDVATTVYGMILNGNGTYGFYINTTTYVVSRFNVDNGRFAFNSINSVNGKVIPAFPSSTGGFDLKQVSGTLTWVAEGEYVADNTLTVLGYTKMSVISVSADTTFTFATPAANSYPEYQALITNSGNVGITLTFTGVSNILCNDPDCVVTNATNSTIVVPSGVTLEINVVNGKMCAINFEVA